MPRYASLTLTDWAFLIQFHRFSGEWLECIREGGQPSCNIERGFEEAITCHMATRSYLEGRKVYWDPVKRRIV